MGPSLSAISFLALFLSFSMSSMTWASEDLLVPSSFETSVRGPDTNSPWKEIELELNKNRKFQYENGWSYVLSGALVGVGGLVGSNITEDPAEKGLYSVFQTIGIASVGYGFFLMRVETEDQLLFSTLQTGGLNNSQKLKLWNTYHELKKQRIKREDSVRAITHALIAAVNFLNASQQKQPGVRNTLLFVGGANALASISYSFSF